MKSQTGKAAEMHISLFELVLKTVYRYKGRAGSQEHCHLLENLASRELCKRIFGTSSARLYVTSIEWYKTAYNAVDN